MSNFIVPIIVANVYLLIEIYKLAFSKGKQKYQKLIPIIAGLLGIAISVTAFYLAPELIPVKNIISAIMIGASSGLAATGTNQIFKQMLKDTEEEKIVETNK